MKLNMEQITRLVYDLSRSEHIADDKVIEKYFEFFSDEYRLDKYLKNVVISNFKNNSLGAYSKVFLLNIRTFSGRTFHKF